MAKDLSEILAYLDNNSHWLLALLVLALGIPLTRLTRRAIDRLSHQARLDRTIASFLRQISAFMIWLVLLTVAAGILGIHITGLLATIGILGLVLALAAQDTLANLFASLMLLVDRPFRVGDWVLVDNDEGTIEDVGLRSTKIRTFADSLIIVPNSILANRSIENFGRRTYRRYSTHIDLTCDTTPALIEAFRDGIEELILQHPHTRKDYYHVRFHEMGDYALRILLYVFWRTPDWGAELRERERLLLDILRLGESLHIRFAYPTRQIILDGEIPRATESKSGSITAITETANSISEAADSARARELARELAATHSNVGEKMEPAEARPK